MLKEPYTKPLLNILLIEDSKSDALLIERELNTAFSEGYTLHKAVTLEEAINLLPKSNFHVALLDRTLPDADEFEGLYRLQNMAPGLPIVFLTSYQNERTAFESIKNGAQDYLLKDKSNGHIIKHAIQFAICRKQYESILIEHANFDVLTGLANRWLFENRLDMAIAKVNRNHAVFALLFLDLDLFKKINDTHGHAVGDKVLKEVSNRLKQIFRPYDTIARFGGDEFAILFESMNNVTDAVNAAERIITLIEKPISVSGNELSIGVSIGIAIANHDETILPGTLIQKADAAMYRAKLQPGSCYFFSDK